MQIQPEPPGVALVFFPAEAHFLAGILRRIAEVYTDANRGLGLPHALEGSGYGPDDMEAWSEELRVQGSEHAAWALRAVDILLSPGQDWVRWVMAPADVERFLLLANDHRMFLAARFGVDEGDMEADPDDLPDDARRMAMLEIHLLAHLMELLLPYAPI